MVFTSTIFLGLFLPLLFIIYFLCPPKLRNYVITIFSLLFYAWGEPNSIWLMLTLILVNYLIGLGIYYLQSLSKIFLSLGIIINLSSLICYKYLSFFLSSLWPIFSFTGHSIKIPEIALPIGISFYTFQIISYLIDIYRKEVVPQKNPVKFTLYVSFFPQLIAGPIVRYSTIAQAISNRQNNFENIYYGITRFVIGLAKKAIIADTMAKIADTIFAVNASDIPTIYCWIGAIAYMLQIFFDFSGYSDMAIGLGRIFNFHFLENFNYPYIATSVQDFWHRWHISLSTWFKDYLYIPLGGNRCGIVRTYLNLLIVFVLCGLWHGASWTFVCWGIYHGLGLLIERAGFNKLLMKVPACVKHLYLLIFILIGWVLFRSETLNYAFSFLTNMFTGSNAKFTSFTQAFDLISIFNIWIFLIALICSTPIINNLLNKCNENIKIALTAGLLFITYTIVMTSNYSPFIYFRF